jgi:hypothetical protein
VADITALPAKWRSDAADPAREHAVVMSLQQCAHELEEAWHDHAHDGEFEHGCRYCDAEIAQYGDGEGNRP